MNWIRYGDDDKQASDHGTYRQQAKMNRERLEYR